MEERRILLPHLLLRVLVRTVFKPLRHLKQRVTHDHTGLRFSRGGGRSVGAHARVAPETRYLVSSLLRTEPSHTCGVEGSREPRGLNAEKSPRICRTVFKFGVTLD